MLDESSEDNPQSDQEIEKQIQKEHDRRVTERFAKSLSRASMSFVRLAFHVTMVLIAREGWEFWLSLSLNFVAFASFMYVWSKQMVMMEEALSSGPQIIPLFVGQDEAAPIHGISAPGRVGENN